VYKTPKRFVEAIVEIAVGRRVSGYTWIVWNAKAEGRGVKDQDRSTGAIEIMNIPFGQTPLEFGLWPVAAINMTDSLVTLTMEEAKERSTAGISAAAPAPWSRAARNPLVNQVSIDPLIEDHLSFSSLINQRAAHARQWLSCVTWKSVEAELVRALQWYESAEYAAECAAREAKLAEEAKRQYRGKIANQEHEKAPATETEAPRESAAQSPTETSAVSDRATAAEATPVSATKPIDVAAVAPEDASEDIKKILNTPVAAEGHSVESFLSESAATSASSAEDNSNSGASPAAEASQSPETEAPASTEAGVAAGQEYQVLESTEDKQVYLMADGTKVVQWLKTNETEWYHNGTEVEVTKQKADGTVEYRYRSGDVVTVPPAIQ
jgi:superoxide dismutase